jgi:hypothetical protein
MAGYDIVHVAIAPPEILEASLIKEVAAILNKDLYGTRLLLAGEIPRIGAHYQTTQAAESVANRLKALGIVAIVCNDSELRRSSPVGFRAHTLKLEVAESTFWDKSGEARRIQAENVSLILKGRMQTYTDKEVTTTKMKFSLPATILTGGIPIWRKVKEKNSDVSFQTESFVRLYNRMSPEPSVEIFESDFDYSFLGEKIAPSSFTNLNTIIAELRNTFPQAIFDDKLSGFFRADASFTTQRDDIEVSCKLIYLCHKVVSNFSPSA